MIPGLGRSSGEGNGNPLQCSGLENTLDGGDWLAIVHGVSKSQTQLRDFTFTFQATLSTTLEVLTVKEIERKSFTLIQNILQKCYYYIENVHQQKYFN